MNDEERLSKMTKMAYQAGRDIGRPYPVEVRVKLEGNVERILTILEIKDINGRQIVYIQREDSEAYLTDLL